MIDKEIILLINKIKANLTPDLLKKEYRDSNKNNPMFGHCYVATETLFHMLYDVNKSDDNFFVFNGVNDNEFKPHYGKDDNNITHWWLQNSEGKILDITSEQYTSFNKVPPYKNGRKGYFLTKYPSKRAKKLIERILCK